MALALAEEPAAKAILAADKLAATDPVKLGAWWRANLALLRSRDALGNDEAAAKLLASLSEALAGDPALREKAPEAAAETERIGGMLAEREALASRLARPAPADDPSLLEAMKKIVSSGRSPRDRWRGIRWIHRKIAALQDPANRALVAALWRSCIAAPASDPPWQGLPEGCRSRALAVLASLEAGGQ